MVRRWNHQFFTRQSRRENLLYSGTSSGVPRTEPGRPLNHLRNMRVKKYGCPNDGSICPSRTYGSMSRPGPVSGSDEMVPECVALDVHKRTITASYVGSDAGTWRFPTTREGIVNELKQYGNMPVVLEAGTMGKAVASFLIAEGREPHMAAPNMVAMGAKAQVKTDKRDAETLAHLYRTGFLPECYVPPPDIEMLWRIARQRRDSPQTVACEEPDTRTRVQEVPGHGDDRHFGLVWCQGTEKAQCTALIQSREAQHVSLPSAGQVSRGHGGAASVAAGSHSKGQG